MPSGQPYVNLSAQVYPIALNIGAGNERLVDGFVTLDANPILNPDIVATVPPIPLPDESCNVILASHFLEHLTDEKVAELMAEVWRVLTPGGSLQVAVPYVQTHGAFQDPTHRSYWVPEKFLYYTPHFDYLGYGFENRFQAVSMVLDKGRGEVRAVMVKTETLQECACWVCEAAKGLVEHGRAMSGLQQGAV